MSVLLLVWVGLFVFLSGVLPFVLMPHLGLPWLLCHIRAMLCALLFVLGVVVLRVFAVCDFFCGAAIRSFPCQPSMLCLGFRLLELLCLMVWFESPWLLRIVLCGGGSQYVGVGVLGSFVVFQADCFMDCVLANGILSALPKAPSRRSPKVI